MKLRKLLPLATIASTAAIVTPLVTSCGSGYTLNLRKKKEYKMVEKATGSMKETDATAKYFEAISKNPKIYADDIFWVNIKHADTDIPEGVEGSVTIKNIKIDNENHTISASYIEKQKGEVTIEGHKQKADLAYTYEITNIPFEMSYYAIIGAAPAWHLDPKYGEDLTKWAADDKWTATTEGHYYAWVDDEKVSDLTTNKTTFNSKSQGIEAQTYVYSIVQAFCFLESYYFSDVTLEK